MKHAQPKDEKKMFLSVPTNDKNRSIDLLELWLKENLREWFGYYFVSCIIDKIACSAETWCLTVMAGTLKSVLGVWPYKNQPSAYEMENTALQRTDQEQAFSTTRVAFTPDYSQS